MAAPKGNKFAKNHKGNKGGRPSKLTPEIVEKAKGYIAWCEANPIISLKTKTVTVKTAEHPEGYSTVTEEQEAHPRLATVAGLARYLNVSKDTLYEWAKANKDFSDAKDEATLANEEIAWAQGAAGTLNATITRLALNQHGYRETKDITSDGKALPQPILGGFDKA